MSERRIWTHDETIVAFNLFCTIPFNECRASHPTIRDVAKLIDRTPAALNMKIGNLGRFDPTLAARGVTGLVNGASLDKIVWDEFYDNFSALALKSEQILANLRKENLQVDLPDGYKVERVVEVRVNQDFFRRMVLSSYNYKCCISGVSNPNLLEACHISDWSKDLKNRINPHNGLSLTPTLHKAYDSMLIAISPDLQVVVSDELLNETMRQSSADFFRAINGIHINLPDRFNPSRELLDAHFQKFLNR